MNASYTFLLNHLLQSTAFCIPAALLASLLRNNRAEVRFRIWMTASVKFFVPFSWIVSAGRAMKVPAGATPATPVLHAAQQLERSFTLSSTPVLSVSAAAHSAISPADILPILWASGAACVLVRWGAA